MRQIAGSPLVSQENRPVTYSFPAPEPLLGVKEAAALLNVRESWIYQHVRARVGDKLPHSCERACAENQRYPIRRSRDCAKPVGRRAEASPGLPGLHEPLQMLAPGSRTDIEDPGQRPKRSARSLLGKGLG
jgi:hypothetical protein